MRWRVSLILEVPRFLDQFLVDLGFKCLLPGFLEEATGFLSEISRWFFKL